MIVKFLYTTGPNGHFPAVSYNTGKMDRNKGELMKVSNFGPLQGLSKLRPQDYKNYLKMVSALNKNVKKPQLHVAISCEGREYDKQQLTEMATQWLKQMGYGKQPYLIVFHKDTLNHHVHIVSTRVGLDGKKIRDSFEQVRGYQQMNTILGIDEKHNANADVDKALAYRFTTKAQFLLILESMGYSHKAENEALLLFKFGKRQGDVSISEIEKRIGIEQADESRKKQIVALFHKYSLQYNTTLYRHHDQYRSALSLWLKEKMGIELVFHFSADKPPYGYSIIDHAQRNVFKGGEIMPLKKLLAIQAKVGITNENVVAEQTAESLIDEKQRKYYAAILKAVLHNYPDMVQGLHHQRLTLTRQGDDFFLSDPGAGITTNTEDLLDEKDYELMTEQFSQSAGSPADHQHIYVPGVTITDDIDDEAIHGHSRRRKKKARTNQR
jgi:hypothetical protein